MTPYETAHADGFQPLPHRAQRLLAELTASPRLIAHLILVHDVAVKLTEAIGAQWPRLEWNLDAIRFGAATHDIGKAVVVDELNGPGHIHEEIGRQALVDRGVEPDLARFAVTHARDPSAFFMGLEDLMVIAADKLWKGRRIDKVEEEITTRIAEQVGADFWDVHPIFTEMCDRVAARADERLAWQGRFPIKD